MELPLLFRPFPANKLAWVCLFDQEQEAHKAIYPPTFG